MGSKDESSIDRGGEESLHTIQKRRSWESSDGALDGNPGAEGLKAADEGLAVDISDEECRVGDAAAQSPGFPG